MADRIGVINKGELILVEEKAELMRKLGKKQLKLHLQRPTAPRSRQRSRPAYASGAGERTGSELIYTLRRQRRARRASPRC